MTVDVDVAVVGGGGAGLAAAVTASDAGASVAVFEAGDTLGGSTALAGGSFMAAGTHQQAECGYPNDTPDDFFAYYMTFNRWCLDVAVVRRFCDAGPATLEWLESLGAEFPAALLTRAGLESAPRSHRIVGGGSRYVELLHAACRDRGVDVVLKSRVEELLRGDDGVQGLRSRGEEVRARSIVLTTGGFAANRELLARHYPDVDIYGDRVWSPCPMTNQGDGIALADSVGAAMTGHNHGDLVLSSGITKDLEPYTPGWLVYINAEGRRFVDEAAPYTVMPHVFAAQGGSAWCVFDEASRALARADHASPWGAGSWTAEVLQDAIERGIVVSSPDVEALAGSIGVRAGALCYTIERYNADCAAGADTQFFKDPTTLRPVTTPPFYAVKVQPSVAAVTGYGVRIDPEARALDLDGRPIPGLFAAGEVTGNVLGAQYIGGGNAIGSALIFGRIAGRSAVRGSRHS